MKIKKAFVFIFLILLAFLLPLLPVAVYFGGNWYSFFDTYSLGMLFGLFSFIYFLNTLILSTRLKWLDRIFGHDKVIIFHGYYAMAALAFAIAHIAFKLIDSMFPSVQTGFGMAGFMLFLIILALTATAMANNAISRIRIFAFFKKPTVKSKKLNYSKLKFMHNFTVAASLIIVIHVFLASSTQESLFRIWFVNIWALLAIGFYIFSKLIRPAISYSRGWRLTNLSKLNSSTVELSISPAKTNRINQLPGQFCYIRILSKVCGIEEHPFTISSPPSSEPLRLTIKNVGDYTGKLIDVPVGSRIIFDGPYGVFTPKEPSSELLFIAGGIGITPFLSIVRAS